MGHLDADRGDLDSLGMSDKDAGIEVEQESPVTFGGHIDLYIYRSLLDISFEASQHCDNSPNL
jgi:hypothetical protein